MKDQMVTKWGKAVLAIAAAMGIGIEPAFGADRCERCWRIRCDHSRGSMAKEAQGVGCGVCATA